MQWLERPISTRLRAHSGCRLWGRVLYIVSHSFPFSSNGYAVRTHGVATGLVRAGCQVVAASRPGVPWDQPGLADSRVGISHDIDGVRYVHTHTPSEHAFELQEYLSRSADAFCELVRVFKPAVIMAASNWRNALPAAIAAREMGVPFFYEVRGFWEVSQAARDPGWGQSPDFLMEVARETQVAKASQRVFTLNRFMRDELVRRGVATERIDLVPNGFAGCAPVPAVSVSRVDLGISSPRVVGYVGSFSVYEGIEELIEALALTRQRGIDVALLLVGSGEPRGFGVGEPDDCAVTASYRRLAQTLGVSDFLHMPGRVAAAQVSAYYSLLDVVVIPRRPLAVSELVSPIKPLEAAAHGKRVLMSDVAPLADLAGLWSYFSYFAKGSVNDLANKLVDLLQTPQPPLAQSTALDSCTWEKHVAPMVEGIRAFGARLPHLRKQLP
ncbi:glycosyltransferase [Acidovorax sp. LjRoot66]|uniref:glycosyltransferase n=1 Tax=Acidovorax sp. LjRoot66 TaxID=3342334 RepID=UPI003ECED9A5